MKNPCPHYREVECMHNAVTGGPATYCTQRQHGETGRHQSCLMARPDQYHEHCDVYQRRALSDRAEAAEAALAELRERVRRAVDMLAAPEAHTREDVVVSLLGGNSQPAAQPEAENAVGGVRDGLQEQILMLVRACRSALRCLKEYGNDGIRLARAELRGAIDALGEEVGSG